MLWSIVPVFHRLQGLGQPLHFAFVATKLAYQHRRFDVTQNHLIVSPCPCLAEGIDKDRPKQSVVLHHSFPRPHNSPAVESGPVGLDSELTTHGVRGSVLGSAQQEPLLDG